MSIKIGLPTIDELRPRIVVIGVGGAGGNAIANMIQAQVEGVDFVVANTDAQALNNSIAETRIQLGPNSTQGLGAGSRPEIGRAAAEETLDEIRQMLEGVHMVFIAAGMGGGTGTGAAPIIAQAAREMGILTVGVVSKPFLFEGTRRMRSAEAGIEELQKNVDTLIVIPNQNLFLIAKAETTFKEAFQLADEVLQQGVRSITDLMILPGLINLDFADVRSVMGEMGKAMMGTGEGEGPNRALEAAEKAIANPLLDGVSMQGAKGVIISILGGEDMKLLEVDEAANHIRELVDADANIIWGSAFNPDLEGKIRVSVVATGIEQGAAVQAEPAPRPASLGSSLGTSRGIARPAGISAPSGIATPSAPPAAPAPAPSVKPAPASEPFELNTPVAKEPTPPASKPAVPEPFVPAPFSPSSELELGASEELEDEDDDSSDSKYGSLMGSHSAPMSFGNRTPPAAPRAPSVRQDDMFGGNRAAPATPSAPPAAPAPAPARPAGGGSTLFERMTSLSRPKSGSTGSGSDDGEDDDTGSLNIPRFLNRQNNQ